MTSNYGGQVTAPALAGAPTLPEIRARLERRFRRELPLKMAHRRAQVLLTARSEHYDDHVYCSGPGSVPWYRFWRADGSSATRYGTPWLALTELLERYLVEQLVDHTQCRLDYFVRLERETEAFNAELGEFAEWIPWSAIEGGYLAIARQVAKSVAAEAVYNDDIPISASWQGVPVRDDEILAAKREAQLIPNLDAHGRTQ